MSRNHVAEVAMNIEADDYKQIVPLRDFVLVRVLPEGRTAGGLHIPATAQQRERAIVLAVGEGRRYETGVRCVPDVRRGDVVILSPRPTISYLVRQTADEVVCIVAEREIVAIERRAANGEAAA